ncbi:hypothetical protein DER45DRAFT_608625 [Fusarium avenaceum]|nr:hypothetical protein DER45DRAFT_608625 [Fusarium avenaceum]
MEQAKISLVDLPDDVEDHGPRNQPTPEKSSTDITEYAQAREDGDDASLVWKGTWDLMLEDEVIDAWRAVVEVEVEKQLLTDEIKSHWDVIKYLGLQSVVDEVSLQQIRAENTLDQPYT